MMTPRASHAKEEAEPARGSMLEAEWKRLRRQIELAGSGYWLVFVFVEDKEEARILRTRTLEAFAERGCSCKIIAPATQKRLATLGLELLGPDVVGQSCVWVEGLEDDPFGRTASPWGDAWKELLMRLNERRDSLQRHISGALFLVLPMAMKIDVREMAPDLWAGRTLVLDLPATSEKEFHAPQGEEFGAIVTANPQMKRVLELAKNVARSRVCVMLVGETGTGKELLAHFIHTQSGVRGSFLAIHCAAIPPELMLMELFGYAKGAFTGAAKTHEGKFEQANGGTLFLDDISALPLDAQAALLRVIETGGVHRIGASKEISVEVRVIVATNIDLHVHVAGGRFREDLYYRLHALPIRIPPLRERPEDITLLAYRFLQHEAGDAHPVGIAPDALHALHRYAWPGNVRELKHVIARARMVMGERNVLSLNDLPDEPRGLASDAMIAGPTARGTLTEQMARAEIEILRQTLIETGGNPLIAAKRLGISLRTLRRKLDRYQSDLGDISEAQDVPPGFRRKLDRYQSELGGVVSLVSKKPAE